MLTTTYRELYTLKPCQLSCWATLNLLKSKGWCEDPDYPIQGDTLHKAVGTTTMVNWMTQIPRTRAKVVRFLVGMAQVVDAQCVTPAYLQVLARIEDALDADPESSTVPPACLSEAVAVPSAVMGAWGGIILRGVGVVLNPLTGDADRGRSAAHLIINISTSCGAYDIVGDSYITRGLDTLLQSMD